MAIMLINGKKTNVIQMNLGGKKTIVMVHGLFTSLSVYYFHIAPRLAKKYHVVLYDLSGHGLSEAGDELLTPKNLSKELVALMLALKIEQAHVVGYSFGGGVALYTALHHPHLVERLTLIDMPDFSEEEFMLQTNNVAHLDFEQEVKRYSQSTTIHIPEQVSRRTMARLKTMFGDGQLTKMLTASRQLLAELPLTQLTTPTLLLYGKKSPYLATGKKLKRLIPHARMQIGKGDHNIPVQSTLWVYWQLRNFSKKRLKGYEQNETR